MEELKEAPKGWDAEFLAKRLGRVAKLAGVPIPERWNYEQVAEGAGTILGQIAGALEALQVDAEPDSDALHIAYMMGHAKGKESRPSLSDAAPVDMEPVELPSTLTVLPMPIGRPQESEEELTRQRQYAEGWNAALWAVAHLGPLYTDPNGTIAALRERVKELEAIVSNWERSFEELKRAHQSVENAAAEFSINANAELSSLRAARGEQKPVDAALLESLIETADGRFVDGEFRIDGRELMHMLRAATLLATRPIEQKVTVPEKLAFDQRTDDDSNAYAYQEGYAEGWNDCVDAFSSAPSLPANTEQFLPIDHFTKDEPANTEGEEQ